MHEHSRVNYRGLAPRLASARPRARDSQVGSARAVLYVPYVRAGNTYECQFVTLWNATVHVYTVKPCTAYMRMCQPWPAQGKTCACAFLVPYVYEHKPVMRLHICARIPLKSSEMAELWTQLMFNFSCRERERKRERGREGGE